MWARMRIQAARELLREEPRGKLWVPGVAQAAQWSVSHRERLLRPSARAVSENSSAFQGRFTTQLATRRGRRLYVPGALALGLVNACSGRELLAMVRESLCEMRERFADASARTIAAADEPSGRPAARSIAWRTKVGAPPSPLY